MTAHLTRVLVAAAAATVMTAIASAHPAGTTSVSIAAAGPRVVRVTIAADAGPLLAKLEVLSGTGPGQSPVSPMEERLRIDALRTTVLAHVELTNGGAPRALSWSDVTVGDDQRATIHLTAIDTDPSQPIVWRTSLVFGSYALVMRPAHSAADTVEWLQGPEPSTAVTLEQAMTRATTIRRALALGYLHILPRGLDHILFVLGLFLLSTRTRQVLLQVSAFTLAHSITLGLTLYGVISLPSRVVEPLIALSVAYVGIENLVTSELKPWRVVIVFGFGLLHGMGFAEALSNLHLASSQFMTTLVGFNIGVEGGQLTVIAIAAVALRVGLHARQAWRTPVTRLASAGIGMCGVIWMISRIA